MDLNNIQFSAYDERPGFPKNSGQGHLFRNQAPAMNPEQRYSKQYTPEGERLSKTMYHGTIADLYPGDEIKPRNKVKIDARDEGSSAIGLGAAAHNASAHTFATHDYAEAKSYADDAAFAFKRKHGVEVQPRVYSVQMNARHSERDPEYYGSAKGRTKSLPGNYFETAHGERVAEHHGELGEEATADSHFRHDDSGNFLAHRSRRNLRVTGEVPPE